MAKTHVRERKRTDAPIGNGLTQVAEPVPENDGAKTDAGRKRPAWVKPVMLVGLLALIVVGVLWGIRYWRFASTHVSTDDAYLTTDIVPITPQVNGNIAQVLMKENQPVEAGQLLVILDDSTFRADVDQARANLASAQAGAQGAGINVALTQETGSAQVLQAEGLVSQAESGIAGANADVARSEAGIANAKATAKSAQANVGNAQAAVTAAIANKKRYADAVTSAQAQVDTAKAGVRAAQAAVDAAQAAYNKAARDATRYASLVSQGAISEQTADQANAAAATARAQLESARQQVAQAQAVVAQKQADLNAARQQLDWSDAEISQSRAQLAATREQAAAASAGIRQSIAQYNASQQSVRQAQARKEQALGQLNQARTVPQQVGVSRSNHLTANAKILQAQAALESAQIALRRTRIYAPVKGRISKKTAEIGQQVAVGQQLMTIIPDKDLWVVGNFKETDLKDVRPGERAEVEVDTFPGRRFTGRVDSISAGTGATFSLLPPDNATGNFTKVVQRVPVKVTFDPGQKDLDRLRAGLSATIIIAPRGK